MRLFIVAFQFLTIVPLPFQVRCEEEDLGRSMALFPLVGLAIGGLLVLCDLLLAGLLPRGVADLVLVVVSTVVTGGLHLDGLADVCDGLAARGSRERFLEVMKDPRVGAVGAAALFLGLFLKYQALVAVPGDYKTQALFFFPLAARFGQVLLSIGSQSARKDGLGRIFLGGAGRGQLAVACAATMASTWLLLGLKGLYCLLVLAAMTSVMKWWFHRKLGGITGDIIGCTSELNEIGALLLLLMVLR